MELGLDINEIPYKFILDNSHTGLKVRLLLKTYITPNSVDFIKSLSG